MVSSLEKPVVSVERCVRTLSWQILCDQCAACCPQEALEISSSPLDFSISDRCDGCALCATRCPAEAILAQVQEGGLIRDGGLLIHCQKSGRDRADVVEGPCLKVPCLKDVGHRFLLGKWFLGLRRLFIRGADCSRCEMAAPDDREHGLNRVNMILDVAGEKPLEVLSLPDMGSGFGQGAAEEPPLPDKASNRRGFLKGLVSTTLEAALPSLAMPDASHDRAGQGQEFFAALQHLDRGARGEGEERLAAYQCRVSHEDCYGCSVCAKLCPTEALTWKEKGNASDYTQLQIDPAQCHGCRACQNVCDVGAIDVRFQPGLSTRETVLFQEKRCHECNRCFLSVRPSVLLCPGCRAGSVLSSPGRQIIHKPGQEAGTQNPGNL